MKLSVIVLTSPEFETDLEPCLEMLRQQSEPAPEILVMDSASETGAAVCQKFLGQLKLQHIACPEGTDDLQAFMLGAQRAQGHYLLCLQANNLLNPMALKVYLQLNATFPDDLAFGYLGEETSLGQTAYAPSRWIPGRQVCFLDKRFHFYKPEKLVPTDKLLRFPHWFANNSNFCLSRELALTLSQASGLSSLQQATVWLAYCCLNQGHKINFVLDTWAEKLVQQPSQKPVSREPLKLPLVPESKPGCVIFTAYTRQGLLKSLFEHYLNQNTRLTQARKSLRLPDNHIDNQKGFTSQLKQLYLQRPQTARPDFLIIGAQKAGTTSLEKYLQIHPQLNAADTKEIHYFDRDLNYQKGFDWYLEQFLFEPGKLSFESTASYFRGEQCPARIAAALPDIRLIALLRNPIERAFSAWNMYSRRQSHTAAYQKILNYDPLPDPRSFEQAIKEELCHPSERDYLERGAYARQLGYYLQYFKRSQILLLDFDLLASQPNQLLQACWNFLEIDPAYQLESQSAQIFNKGEYDETIPQSVRDLLEDYYAEDKRLLREEFGLNYAWLEV